MSSNRTVLNARGCISGFEDTDWFRSLTDEQRAKYHFGRDYSFPLIGQDSTKLAHQEDS